MFAGINQSEHHSADNECSIDSAVAILRCHKINEQRSHPIGVKTKRRSTGHGLIADGIVSQVTVDCDERALYTLHGAAGRHTTAPASRVHRQLYFAPVDGQREKGQKSMAPPFV